MTVSGFFNPELCARLASLKRTRLGGGYVLSLDDKATLQVRGATVHKTRSDDRMLFQLRRQSFEEGAALHGMDRRGGRLNGGEFVIG
jgi:hypothetical protein